MPTNIFINLPVKNLNRSIDFFTRLGFKFNQQFTDETATCMIVSDNIYFMLLTHEKFKSFTNKEVMNTKQTPTAIFALSAESRQQVDEMADKAMAAGSTSPIPMQEHGFMYSRSFQDPDGHLWEVFWMDPKHIQKEEA